MYYDSEWDKMMCAQRCKREKTGGFQGCKSCGDGGFYLAQYSKEGYCSKCELKFFPERFYPCIHCRAPSSLPMSCLECNAGMEDWIEKTNNSAKKCEYQFEIMSKCLKWDDMANKLTKAGNHDGKRKYSNGWGGFYMGIDEKGVEIWKKLPYLPVVTDGGICIEEPWYIPEWTSLEELNNHVFVNDKDKCAYCQSEYFLKVSDGDKKYCDEICRERDR